MGRPLLGAPGWGWQNIAVQFMGAGHGGAASDPHGSVPLVASRWSARWNGTQTADTSAVARIKYDWRGFQAQRFGIDVRALRPGLVELSATSLDASLPAADHYTFWQFWLRKPGNPTPLGQQQAATFTSKDLNTMVQSVNGSIRVAFAAPGLYYWGVTGELQGLHGHSSANGTQCGVENYWAEIGICAPGSAACGADCLPFTTPLALKVVGPAGETGNASLPTGFSGGLPVLLPPLARPYQLCVITTEVTLFSGGRLALPICSSASPIPPAAGVNRLSVRAPAWMVVSTVSGHFAENCVRSNETSSDSFVTTTCDVDVAKHKVYGMLGLFFRFNETSHAASSGGGAGSTFTLNLALHDADAAPSTLTAWQQLTATTVVLPAAPASFDTRLVGSITWAESHPVAGVGAELLLDHNTMSFVETYARLGFNFVPQIFTEHFVPPAYDIFGTPPPLLYPVNRSGPMWSRGLKFGPMHEGFKQFFSLPQHPDASLLPHWVSPSETRTELLKWQRALNFSHGKWPTVLDLAYDGAFFLDDVNTFCAAMEIMQPDIVFVDDEGWGGGWHSWWVEGGVNHSANAQARRLVGESDLDLAVRMVMELLERWTSCLRTVSPHTRVAHYGAPFPELMMRAGILQQIGYDQVFFPSAWVSQVREQRQLSDALPTPVPVIPWISSCTWGQLSKEQLRSATLHAFGSGAAGFSFFRDSCIDDPGKLLALSAVLTLMRPFEGIVLDGSLASREDGGDYATHDDGDGSLWSGMHHPRLGMLLVLTPASPRVRVTIMKRYASGGSAKLIGAGLLVPVEGLHSEFVLSNLTAGSAVVLHFGA